MSYNCKKSKSIAALLISVILVISMFIVPSASAAEDQIGNITVSSVTANPGDTVTIAVDVTENPGIMGMTLDIKFDESALTLLDVKDGGILGLNSHQAELAAPYRLSWGTDTLTTNITATGTIVTLKFTLKESAIKGKSYSIVPIYDYDNFDIYDVDTKPVKFNITPGSITVKGSEPVHTHSLTKVAAKAATCTEDGNKEYFVCDGCSKWFEDEAAATEITDHDSVIIKAAHTPSDWIVDKEATESEKGSKHKECTVCGEILEKAEIPVIKPTEPPTDKPTDDPTKPTDDPTKPTDKPTQPGTKTTTGTSSVQSTPKSNGKSGVVNTGDGSLVFLFAVVMIGGCVSAYLINNYRKKKTSK